MRFPVSGARSPLWLPWSAAVRWCKFHFSASVWKSLSPSSSKTACQREWKPRTDPIFFSVSQTLHTTAEHEQEQQQQQQLRGSPSRLRPRVARFTFLEGESSGLGQCCELSLLRLRLRDTSTAAAADCNKQMLNDRRVDQVPSRSPNPRYTLHNNEDSSSSLLQPRA